MTRMKLVTWGVATFLLIVAAIQPTRADDARPNIVLMMADDQGWGETSYNGHPVLRTPNLDAMAKAGLLFHRFYAAGPVCSPTRASVLTGRTHFRTGVESHGYALRLQEPTLSTALRAAGYHTSHFGKWHLNGLRGPGVPILGSDDHSPGHFGFDDWLSVTNFFDRDPILSRRGQFEEFQGDSSEIVVAEAIENIRHQVRRNQPFFTVIWFGTPHSPFVAAQADKGPFAALDEKSQNHYGELVAMDRAVGTLRAELRSLNIAQNTLFWFCSDNGGLPGITPSTVGDLRGYKGSLYEGGLRVPGIIEWPAGIPKPRTTHVPAVALDIAPTIAEIVGLPDSSFLQPQDGMSLEPLFTQQWDARPKPIPFHCFGETALIDNEWKLLHVGRGRQRDNKQYELYNLSSDPGEQKNLFAQSDPRSTQMLARMKEFQASVQASFQGHDYPERTVAEGEPVPRFWMDVPHYEPYFDDWRDRPEYRARLRDK